MPEPLSPMAWSPVCPVCRSGITHDCGEVFDGKHHVECPACGCASLIEKPSDSSANGGNGTEQA